MDRLFDKRAIFVRTGAMLPWLSESQQGRGEVSALRALRQLRVLLLRHYGPRQGTYRRLVDGGGGT
jgi:hypothetical protein